MSSYDGLCPDCREIECTDGCMGSNSRIVSNFRRMANNADQRATAWEEKAKQSLRAGYSREAMYYAGLARYQRLNAREFRRMAEELSR